MKKYVICAVLLFLMCSSLFVVGYVSGINKSNYTNMDYNQLNSKIEELKEEKSDLESSIEEIRINNGTAKYVVTFHIKQTHFTLDIGEHIKDSMNDIEFDVMVDKEYYDSVSIGTVINDDFRVGSFVIHGSFGNWKVTVSDKQVIEGEE